MTDAKPIDEQIAANRAGQRRGSAVLAIGAILMLGLFGVAVWYGYTKGFKPYTQSAPRLVKAPDEPIRVKPEDRGGMEVPHRERLIFEAMNGEDEAQPVERLLPPPEEPREPPKQKEPEVVVVETREARPPSAETVTPAPEPAVAKTTAEPDPPPPPALPTPQPKAAPAKVAKTAPEAPAVTEAPKSAPLAAPPAAKGAFRIQIASYRQAEVATAGWAKLQKSYPRLLRPLSPQVVRVDLGAEKGIYYRLTAGPLPDKDAAQALCEALKTHNVGCLVVKP